MDYTNGENHTQQLRTVGDFPVDTIAKIVNVKTALGLKTISHHKRLKRKG